MAGGTIIINLTFQMKKLNLSERSDLLKITSWGMAAEPHLICFKSRVIP